MCLKCAVGVWVGVWIAGNCRKLCVNSSNMTIVCAGGLIDPRNQDWKGFIIYTQDLFTIHTRTPLSICGVKPTYSWRFHDDEPEHGKEALNGWRVGCCLSLCPLSRSIKEMCWRFLPRHFENAECRAISGRWTRLGPDARMIGLIEIDRPAGFCC